MLETMQDAGGVGLAAPQVHVPLRLFVFHIPAERVTGTADMPIGNSVLINPTVTLLDEAKQTDWEGCLSLPGLRAVVPRASRIRYVGVDTDGQTITREVQGFHARVIQHENDHLDGILYTMRMTDFRPFGFQEELARAQKAEAEAAQSKDQGEPAIA
jgi:peptide deformylase